MWKLVVCIGNEQWNFGVEDLATHEYTLETIATKGRLRLQPRKSAWWDIAGGQMIDRNDNTPIGSWWLSAETQR